MQGWTGKSYHRRRNIERRFHFMSTEEYNQTYVDKIQAAQSSEDPVALWKEIAENSFLNWYVNAEVPQDAVQDFNAIDNLDAQKHSLVELLDKINSMSTSPK